MTGNKCMYDGISEMMGNVPEQIIQKESIGWRAYNFTSFLTAFQSYEMALGG